jgi:small subunit ribosomal protein S20
MTRRLFFTRRLYSGKILFAMPVTVSAKKALRRGQRKTVINRRLRLLLKKALQQARIKPSQKLLSQAASVLDRAAKKRVIHANKAARLKSRLAKLAQKAKKQQKKTT